MFFALGVVVGGALIQIIFHHGIEAEDQFGVEGTVFSGKDLHPGAGFPTHCFLDFRKNFLGHQISLAENHDVGAGQLVLEDLGQRAVMIEHFIGFALCLNGFRVVGKHPRMHGGPIDHRNHTVDGGARSDFWPLERFYQWFR